MKENGFDHGTAKHRTAESQRSEFNFRIWNAGLTSSMDFRHLVLAVTMDVNGFGNQNLGRKLHKSTELIAKWEEFVLYFAGFIPNDIKKAIAGVERVARSEVVASAARQQTDGRVDAVYIPEKVNRLSPYCAQQCDPNFRRYAGGTSHALRASGRATQD